VSPRPKGTREFALAVLGHERVRWCDLLPVAFMAGCRRFFSSFGLSWLVRDHESLSCRLPADPILCSRFLTLEKRGRARPTRVESGGCTGDRPVYGKALLWARATGFITVRAVRAGCRCPPAPLFRSSASTWCARVEKKKKTTKRVSCELSARRKATLCAHPPRSFRRSRAGFSAPSASSTLTVIVQKKKKKNKKKKKKKRTTGPRGEGQGE